MHPTKLSGCEWFAGQGYFMTMRYPPAIALPPPMLRHSRSHHRPTPSAALESASMGVTILVCRIVGHIRLKVFSWRPDYGRRLRLRTDRVPRRSGRQPDLRQYLAAFLGRESIHVGPRDGSDARHGLHRVERRRQDIAVDPLDDGYAYRIAESKHRLIRPYVDDVVIGTLKASVFTG